MTQAPPKSKKEILAARAKVAVAPGKVKGSPTPPRKITIGDLSQWFNLKELLTDDIAVDDVIVEEADTISRHRRLMNLVKAQAMAIGLLSLILVFAAPVLRPINRYFTFKTPREKSELISLFAPNLTDRAILSWSATSVTEVMTIGFGDFDHQIIAQRKRFTSRGWDSFQQALKTKKLRDEFKSKQLVLTTVPSDVAVIVGQGPDPENGYQWKVEIPIIMTFVTNNNVSKKSNAIIRLTIVRVPSKENVGGIAIETWDLV